MDEFRKKIRSLRDEMDSEAPPEVVFKRITKSMAPAGKSKIVYMAWWAAAAAAVVLALFLVISRQNPGPVAAPALAKTAPAPPPADTLLAANPVPVKPADTVEIVPASAPGTASRPASRHRNAPPASEPQQLLQSFERNYAQLVNLQLESIRSTPVLGESNGYFDEFKTAFRQLETDELHLKNTIRTSGLNDALLEQLITIYQSKIDLLKNLQKQVARMNNRVQENLLPTDSVSIFYINI